jgi:hypothetical protein
MLKIEGQVIKPWEMMVSQGFIYSWNYGGISSLAIRFVKNK